MTARTMPILATMVLFVSTAGAQVRVGAEFQVDQSGGYPSAPDVAMDAAGNAMVVWENLSRVKARVYDPDGVPVGGEMRVTDRGRNPAVGAARDGGFVVVWETGGSSDVFARRYDATGSSVSGAFLVNSLTAGTQVYPDVDVDREGNFVVTWQSSGGGGPDTSGGGIRARRFDRDGGPLGLDFQVNSHTPGAQWYPAVAVDPAGDFVVVWTTYGNANGSYENVDGQRFASDGTTRGGEFQVNASSGYYLYQQNPAVAQLDGKGFVVVWESDGEIQGQRFDAAGHKQGGEFPVNTLSDNSQGEPAVAVGGDDGFVVAWSSFASAGSDDSYLGVEGQLFRADAGRRGSEFAVNSTTYGFQWRPSVAADAAGNFVVVWESWDYGSYYYGGQQNAAIRAQRLTGIAGGGGPPPGGCAAGLPEFAAASEQASRLLADDVCGGVPLDPTVSSLVRKKATKAIALIDKAACATKDGKRRRLLKQAAKQLRRIDKKTGKFERKGYLSTECGAAMRTIVSEGEDAVAGAAPCGKPTASFKIDGRAMSVAGTRNLGYFQGIGCFGDDCVAIGIAIDGGKRGIALLLDDYRPSQSAKDFSASCDADLGYEKDRALGKIGDEDVWLDRCPNVAVTDSKNGALSGRFSGVLELEQGTGPDTVRITDGRFSCVPSAE